MDILLVDACTSRFNYQLNRGEYEPKIQFALLFEEVEEGGLMPIYMRASVAGKRTEFATQREWDLTKWNAAAGRASGTKEAAKELNTYLNLVHNYCVQKIENHNIKKNPH